jgi:hypothetical protein
MSTPQEAMRQEFEAFARDHHWNLERLLTGDGYLSHETAAGWYGWQAALRAQPEAAAQPAQPVAGKLDTLHAANQCVDAAVLFLLGEREWPEGVMVLRDQFASIFRAASSPPSPKTGEGSAIEGVPDLAEHYRKAIAQVCEGWTLPDGARKTLEAALWSSPPAAAAPSGSQEKRHG